MTTVVHPNVSSDPFIDNNRKLFSVYNILCSGLLLPLRIFFREIEVFGASGLPKEGPLLVVAAPHSNLFLDPLVVLHAVEKEISWLAAAVSFKRAFVGTCIKAMKSIPVNRPNDFAIWGTGEVTVSGKTVSGIRTAFNREFVEGSSISFPTHFPPIIVPIQAVVSDAELILKSIPDNLKCNGPTKFKWVPKVDQEEMLANASNALRKGACIGLFPEGFSHEHTEVQPLKAGPAFISLGASQSSYLEVPIVACGLNYFNGRRFRSRVYVDISEPYYIPESVVELYRQGGSERREAVSIVMSNIESLVNGVTLNTPNHKTLLHVLNARRFLFSGEPTCGHRKLLEITRGFATAFVAHRSEPDTLRYIAALDEYTLLLHQYSLPDTQVVSGVPIGRCTLACTFVLRVLLLIALVVLAVPGVLLNLPAMLLVSCLGHRRGKKAGWDEVATYKILFAVVVLPTLWIIYVVLLVLLLHFVARGVPLWFNICAPIITFFAIPIISYATIHLAENGIFLLKSLPAIATALFLPGKFNALRQRRTAMHEATLELAHKWRVDLNGESFAEPLPPVES